MPTDTEQRDAFRIAALSAGLGAVLMTLMVVITLNAGTGYQDFESLRTYGTPERYTEMIALAAPVLRQIYPLDTLYIFAYASLVFAIVQSSRMRAFSWLAILAVVTTALLDFIENNHILTMADAASRGQTASLAQIQFQSVVTQIKFNAGLLLTLTLSFLIPFETRASAYARWLARGLVVAAPVALLTPATTLLYISMNIFFGGLLAYVFWRGDATPTTQLA